MNSKLIALTLVLLGGGLAAAGCNSSELPLPEPTPEPVPEPTPEPVPEPTPEPTPEPADSNTITLPEPERGGDVSLEQSLVERRSVRQYSGEPLLLGELAQLLWAAQGITSSRSFRTSPSAGALYPLEVYVVAGNVEGITPGIYWYHTKEHELVRVVDGDQRNVLAGAALGQSFIEEAAVDLVVTAIYERTTAKYGERGIRYVHIEAGHAAQNALLQATTLGLGAVPVGAFSDESVARILELPDDENPLYIIPVGRRK